MPFLFALVKKKKKSNSCNDHFLTKFLRLLFNSHTKEGLAASHFMEKKIHLSF